MNTLTAPEASWRELAACTGQDTEQFFADTATARTICVRCPVRAECLHDALRFETPGSTRYGVRGGLTGRERNRFRSLPDTPAEAVAYLREHLAAETTTHHPAERTTPAMTENATPASAETELMTVSKLLRWAEEHPEAEVQAQGARAEAALTALRQRYAADQELAAITTEAEKLKRRLAELQAREAELAPPKKRRASPSYKAAEVRAWARERGIAVPPRGSIPKAVLAEWRTATGSAQDES